MAIIDYRVNIQSSILPLLSMLQGETVVIQDRDQTYVPNINPGDQHSAVDRGVPGIYFAENVMPSTYGWQSIGYLARKSSAQLPSTDIVKIQATTNALTTYAAVPAGNVAGPVKLLSTSLNWVNASVNAPAGAKLSTATVNGVTYLCVPRTGVYRVVGGASPSLQAVTLKGVQISNVLGIVSSVGYLICWTATGVAWSSTSDPLDLVPSDVTGAGAAQIQDAAGQIVWCQDTSYGFLLYTRGNVVQSTWSGNTNYPWNFRGIPGSGGIESGKSVSVESNGQHYAYTSKGLQQVYHTGTKTILPYVTDFISGQTIEKWNPTTRQIQVINLPAQQQLTHAVSFIADRYLLLSYGLPSESFFSGAVVFDTVMNRMGKLNLPHLDCFEWQDITAARIAQPRGAIAFAQPDGKISTVNFKLSDNSRYGVMLLGKFQAARGYMSQMLTASMEVIESDAVFELDCQSTLDGKQVIRSLPGYQVSASPLHRVFNFSAWGKNHTLQASGAFNINSVVLSMQIDGRDH